VLTDLILRFRALFTRSAVERELDEELDFHLDRQIEAHVRAGMDPDSARRQARLELGGYSQEAGEQLRRRALEAIARLPGVEAAAYGNSLPLNIDRSTRVVYVDEGTDLAGGELPRATRYQVSPGFVRTLGIRLLRGRDIDWHDTASSRRVAIVNEIGQRRGDAVGRGRHDGAGGTRCELAARAPRPAPRSGGGAARPPVTGPRVLQAPRVRPGGEE
jgi:hypothetical protein